MPVDVGFYGRNKSGGSLGDILGAVQGAYWFSQNVKKDKLMDKEREDNEYMVSTLGSLLNTGGYDYNNPEDLERLNTDLLNKITKERPDLSSKALGNYDASVNQQIARQQKRQELENKKLTGDKTSSEIDKNKEQTRGYRLDNTGKEANIILENLSDATQENYDAKVENIERSGIDVTDYKGKSKDFFERPDAYLSQIKQAATIENAIMNAEKTRQAELDTQLKQGDVRWQDREKAAAINRTNSLTEQRGNADDLKLWMKAKSDIDKKYKPLEENISTAGLVINALNSGNPAAIEPIKTKIMRMYGEVGTMTDKDIARAGGDPSIKARMKRWVSKGMKGLPPQKDIEEFTKLVEMARKTNIDRLNTMLDSQEEIYGNRGVDVSDIVGGYRPEEYKDKKSSSKFTIKSVK